MAIHYLQSNMADEDIALGNVQVSIDRPADNDNDETSFINTTEAADGIPETGIQDDEEVPYESQTMLDLQEEEKRKVLDAAYGKWVNKAGRPQKGIPYDEFAWSPAGRYGRSGAKVLVLKAYPDVRIVDKKGREVLALSSIAKEPGGRGLAAIRDVMGFNNYGLKPSAEAEAAKQSALQKGNATLGDLDKEVENVEMQDLGATAGKASNIVKNMGTAFNNAEIDERNEGDTTGIQFPTREIRGLDKALQTIRGELVNNLAKLTELDNHITREQNKLDEPDIGEFERRRIAERIRDLKDERVSRLEAASASREALRSQISRIRETINRLINEDTTLAERIRTLFREQGITIVSILTALGMVISTLVLAVGIGGASAAPPTPPSKAGLREWVKKYLHALGRVLAKLAAKAGAALPGIIGSVVGWLLNLLSKTAGWLASNLWALMLAVGSILLIAAREWLAIR